MREFEFFSEYDAILFYKQWNNEARDRTPTCENRFKTKETRQSWGFFYLYKRILMEIKNMEHAFSRFEIAIGNEKLEILNKKTVIIIGIGGVGSFATEAIARSAIGKIVLIDYDTIDITNINRQIHALQSTIGKNKVEVMTERIRDINPNCEIVQLNLKCNKDSISEIFSYKPDYIVDAIDDLNDKILLIKQAKDYKVPIISSMGTANKLDPAQLTVSDISKTYMDPMAKIVRQKLRKIGIENGVKVVFSPEKPIKQFNDSGSLSSNAFVPSSAGLLIASVVVRDLCDI